MNVAIAAAGVTALLDRRGEPDRAGRPLEVTEVALADALAAAAGLVLGEAAEGTPAVLVRGFACHARRQSRLDTHPPARRGPVPLSVPRVVALSGGVGGAKLALGLYRVLPPDTLTVIVNTGDDFEHLGLHICPDLDTTLYTLAGLAHPELGWGRRDETWTFMQTLEALGGETWFRLGDADLALHVERTRRLKGGATLSAITADLARRLGIEAARRAGQR